MTRTEEETFAEAHGFTRLHRVFVADLRHEIDPTVSLIVELAA